ncbi:DUF1381 domain-containing protein, partial [Staphylococcus aureus]
MDTGTKASGGIRNLVTTFKDSTGQPHEHFTTARDNQTF